MHAHDASAAERREQILGEVAEGLHAVFKEAKRRTLEAEDNAEFVRLSESLAKLARGVRQCLGWHAKLQRDRCADEDAAAQSQELTRFSDVQERKAAVARKVARRFKQAGPDAGDEGDNETFNRRLASLNERLDDLCEAEGFLDLDPDLLVARLCQEFGLAPPQPHDPGPLIPGPLTLAKAGEADTQAESAEPAAPTPRANGHHPHAPDSS